MRVSTQMQRAPGHFLRKRLVSSCADKTRQRLFDAATETLNRRGIQGATTREIARRAGVHEVTPFPPFQEQRAASSCHSQAQPGRESRSIGRQFLKERKSAGEHGEIWASLLFAFGKKQGLRGRV